MSLIPTAFDPTTMRLGVAGKLNDSDNYLAAAVAGAAPGDTVDPAYRAKATEAAVKFESFFIGHMLHQMRDGTRAMAADDSPSKDRINQDMLDMADNLVADQLAGKRAFGIADAILRQLLPAPAAPPAASVALTQNFSETLNRGK